MTKQPSHIFQLRRLFSLAILCVCASLRFNAFAEGKLPLETEAKIRAVLSSPKLKEARVGISILDLGTVRDANDFPAKAPVGKPFRVLFESDAQKKFMPASNMKLFTAAIALELLGKEKTFPTTVWSGKSHSLVPINNVFFVKKANPYLLLHGGGDPSLDTDGLKHLAAQLKDVTIGNTVYGDGTSYGAEPSMQNRPFGWTIDDAQWYYAPEISSLAINRNQIDVLVTGAGQDKQVAVAKFTSAPPTSFHITSTVQTDASLSGREPEETAIQYRWIGGINARALLVSGHIAPKTSVTVGLSIPDPPQLAAAILRDIKVVPPTPSQINSGQNQVEAFGLPLEETRDLSKDRSLSLVAQHNSPPLKTLFHRFLKNSDNLYAEMLLRNAAYYHDGTGGDKAGPRAYALLKKWLIAQDIDTSSLRFEDGSGLSRYNLLTPRATAQLLAAINRMKDGDVIWNALPIAGTDGTLRKRMGSTSASGNVHAKTGTFSIASNLSGYVTTQDHRRLAVSLFINFARDTTTAQKVQDEIFTILADSKQR